MVLTSKTERFIGREPADSSSGAGRVLGAGMEGLSKKEKKNSGTGTPAW